MTPEERESKIASYSRAYETLIAGVRQFPEEMWDFRDEHGCWSIREHLVHIADSEVNSYIRCRRFIGEPGQPLMAYDENAWAASLGYSQQDPRNAIELFRCCAIRPVPSSRLCRKTLGPTSATILKTAT